MDIVDYLSKERNNDGTRGPLTKRDEQLLETSAALLQYFTEDSVKRWKEAFEMEVEGEPKEDLSDPNPAYDSLREAKTYSEFENAANFKRFTVMQCFIIRERILGRPHPDVRRAIYEYLEVHSCFPTDKPMNQRDISLRCYLLHLYHKYDEPMTREFNTVFRIFVACVLSFEEHVPREQKYHCEILKEAAFFFNIGCKELEKYYIDEQKNKDRFSVKDEVIGFASDLLINLRYYGPHWKRWSEAELDRVGVDIRRFVNICNLLRAPLLQSDYLLTIPWQVDYISLVASLGADFHKKELGFTPLVMKMNGQINNQSLEEWPVVSALVDVGSRIFLPMRNKKLVFEALQEGNKLAEKPIVVGKYIKLKDISARIVEISYSEAALSKILPPELLHYIGI
ncbi:unnamed protein product [Caenorhabditis auriculariae]|uniref:Uncharacterized protein n=1 Tax=Caenorhabditis auriculariae TaxID=2777116 RepID=A0A8S1HSK8_9PELO|nr:unnamed protein product [Caenorhabditis auriculariae]